MSLYCYQGVRVASKDSKHAEPCSTKSFSTAKPDSEVSCRHEISDHCFLAWYMKTDIVKK
ncbi:unnamed protein product [Fusarium graminearum]|uniref:Chromosome 4, complete genome n=1 Tax=Gibberella zeae (strain ATCC MYA-4620 / CBS 123657 / FGSC 9075 / NRRL 31084 / PH-1) TaxID=229533 RepID=A0A098DUX8_GIBZE|nr:unnamed protein product [Fusarium graminearum]CZS74259.1 unnamed protein product [Fusarium graminearum]